MVRAPVRRSLDDRPGITHRAAWTWNGGRGNDEDVREIPDDYPEKLIGSYDRDTSPDRFLFKQARCVGAVEPEPIVRFNRLVGDLVGIDDLATNAMVPIVAPRVQRVLLEYAVEDVQLADVRVVARDGELNEYKIVNVTSEVSAIDHEASEYSLIPGVTAVMGFRKLVVVPGALGTQALARDAEYMSNLMVSDDLAERLRVLNPTLLGLYRPEDMVW